MIAFPYFESTLDNSVDNGNSLFFSALTRVEDVSQGKPVWITEAGWPISGPTENQAVASVDNSKTYWDEVGCDLFDNYNVWWYILRDNNALPAPNPSFGIVGIDLEEPLFDLTCPAGSSSEAASIVPASSVLASTAPSSSVQASTDGVGSSSVAPSTVPASTIQASTDGAGSSSAAPSTILTSTAPESSVPVSTSGSASASSTLIANGPEASNVSSENVNVTSAKTKAKPKACKNHKAKLTKASKTAESPPPAAHSSHSTSSIFSGDMPAILESLPSIVAANPSIVKKLPSLLAANPDLMKEVESLDLAKMAADYNVTPVYVDMLQDAIKKCKKGRPTGVVRGAKSIAQTLRDDDGA